MALKSVVKKLVDARAKYDEQLKRIGKNVAKEVAKEIGALLPPGYGLKWTQGTPSFNDGDPCTFSVHDPSLVRLDAEEDESENEEPDDDGETCTGPDEMDLSTAVKRYGKKDKPVNSTYGAYVEYGFPKIEGYTLETLKSLDELWHSLPEDLLQAAFGDGAEVTVKPDGKYDNDDYCE